MKSTGTYFLSLLSRNLSSSIETPFKTIRMQKSSNYETEFEEFSGLLGNTSVLSHELLRAK